MAIARHAILTGGSSGIGKATAMLLAQKGAGITIMARRPDVLASARDEIAARCASPQQRVLAVPVDVADRAAVSAAIAQACAENGPCDLLVASAGIAHPGYFSELDDEIFERTMQINYFGTLYAVRAVVPVMRANRSGRIVMISSGAGLIGLFGYSPYSPTKFAQRGLADCLRAELVRDGIGVSVVFPPDTDTPQLAEEMKTKPLETQALTGSAKTWSADAVAASIVRGIERRQFWITPGAEMYFLSRIHSLLLPALNWYVDRVAAKARPRAS